MAKKMSRRTLALSLSAITAVYLAGYVVTEPTAQKIAAAEASGSVALVPAPTTAASATVGTTVADAASTLAATPEPAPTLPPDATPTRAPTAIAIATAIPTARPTRVIPRPTKTPASQLAGYRDGTYVGLGRSRRGNVEVTVTIQNGKIASANISNCMTQYPQSVIDGLPDEVVTRQSAKIDLVSGATYSSRAFQDAVVQALAQAGQAPATGAILGVGSFA